MALPLMPAASPGFNKETLLAAINRKGLAANLKLCLDIGDAASYPFASGQTWFDRSGNVVDFFRGTSSSVQTNDPTPNGSAGDLSKNTFWSFDGGDCFQANTGASGYSAALAGWISNIHKDGARFTLFAWWFPAAAAIMSIMGTFGIQAAADRGFSWWAHSAQNQLLFSLKHGLATSPMDANTFNLGAWNCVALSVDEPAGTATFFNNGKFSVQPCVYSGADTGNATNTVMISGTGNTGDLRPFPNGSALSQVAVWDTPLSQAQLTNLYRGTKARFR